MNVCFFGIYDPGYARNRVLKEGFERNGYAVRECRVDPAQHRGLVKYWKLYLEYRKLRPERFDQVIVCFPGHTIVWLARILFGRRIIFDAFVSGYDAAVGDRRSLASTSLRAWRLWLEDWLSCTLAYRVLLDTEAHIGYFTKTFGLPRKKFIRVPVGTTTDLFHPRPDIRGDSVFTVHFHGSYIPVQGVPFIIEAARLLKDEDIRFRIIGDGQDAPRVEAMLREQPLPRVERIGRVPLSELPAYIARAHVSLGLFGDRERTLLAVPNKIYEAMAMGKACISADSPAARELFRDQEELLLVPPADPAALAAAILKLREDPALRERIARQCLESFHARFMPKHIVAEMLSNLGVERSSI